MVEGRSLLFAETSEALTTADNEKNKTGAAGLDGASPVLQSQTGLVRSKRSWLCRSLQDQDFC